MLSDLKERTNSTLKNAVSLSKVINADIEFLLCKETNALNTLSNYLVKNKVNLLCLSRGKNVGSNFIMKSEIKDVINKTTGSIFFN